MEKDKALAIVQTQMKEKRYLHTLGVLETAVLLATNYRANEKKVELAAIFHDYAKCRRIDEMKDVVIRESLDERLLIFGNELLHGPVGAYFVKKEVGIEDQEILDAIYYHTTGRPNMTLTEKIIFIADYIEPNRDFPGVEKVRNVAFEDLDEAIIRAIENTIQFLMEKRQPIFPTTFDTYNYFLLQGGNSKHE